MAFFKAKNNLTSIVGDPFLNQVVSIVTDDYTSSFTSAKSLRNSDVFTAVKIIASDIASSPIQCIKDDMPQTDDELTKLLNEKPNNTMDGWHFKFALAVNMLLNGNSFAEIIREEKLSLEILPNSSVTVKQRDNGTVFYQVGENKRILEAENILHFKYFTQDGIIGIPPLHALRDEMKVQEAGNKTIFNFFSRGVNGSGILKVNKSDLDSEAKQRIREEFEKANGSKNGDNALRTIIMDEGFDYKTLEVNTDVLKLINSSDWTTKQIAKCFGIATERLGVESQHSSTVQSNMMYLQNTLVHYFNCFTSELDIKLVSQFKFNTERLSESDPETKIKNVLDQVKGSILTINEGRAKLGHPPCEGGDRLLGSLNYTYLDLLEKYQFRKQEKENGTGKTSNRTSRVTTD